MDRPEIDFPEGPAPSELQVTDITVGDGVEVKAGSTVSVEWSGPNNVGDYVTIVPRSMEDGQYGNYAETKKGSPMTINVPKETGEAELRYMSGQGAKVLARRAVRIVE